MSSFGRLFRVSTFGESHGGAVGCTVEGVPPRMLLTPEMVQTQLRRRRPGQSVLTTDRAEEDAVSIVSGTELGRTLGTPICMIVRNTDHRPGDYASMSQIPRPSHADYTYMEKYGINATSGGGRASARETIGRVAAGAVAEIWLREMFGIEIVAYVSAVGPLGIESDEAVDESSLTRVEVDATAVRCPARRSGEKMHDLIVRLKEEKDSTGGVVRCVARRVPSGWGEPCFDKMEALLAHAMLSIPSTKGFEVGSGFRGAAMRGSQHNDAFVGRDEAGKLRTATNNSGGIQGGISNGESIVFSVAFKPPATIGLPQNTASYDGLSTVLESKGRHDPCVVPRAVPIVEAMTALVLADCALMQMARSASAHSYPKPV